MDRRTIRVDGGEQGSFGPLVSSPRLTFGGVLMFVERSLSHRLSMLRFPSPSSSSTFTHPLLCGAVLFYVQRSKRNQRKSSVNHREVTNEPNVDGGGQSKWTARLVMNAGPYTNANEIASGSKSKTNNFIRSVGDIVTMMQFHHSPVRIRPYILAVNFRPRKQQRLLDVLNILFGAESPSYYTFSKQYHHLQKSVSFRTAPGPYHSPISLLSVLFWPSRFVSYTHTVYMACSVCFLGFVSIPPPGQT